MEFYEQQLFRKHRWNIHVNTQRSKANFVNRFKETFGPPEEVLIGIGNWSDSRHHMKHHEPTKGVGFRRLFRAAGYAVYLVDEYRTSKKCSECKKEGEEGICSTFLDCKNPRLKKKKKKKKKEEKEEKEEEKGEGEGEGEEKEKKKEGEGESSCLIRCHGLVRCSTCTRLWNRDTNASLNIGTILQEVVEGRGRPKYLQRGQRGQKTDQPSNANPQTSVLEC